jgi:hypothetical protein
MPNRIIKESICSSANLNELSPEEEVFFYRLIVSCDDFGRLDARPPILRAKCFPLKLNTITDEAIVNRLKSLQIHKLIRLYIIEGQPYLEMVTWDKHQQVRAKRSKYPDPDGNLITSDDICNQLLSNVPVIQSNPIQSESLSESKATSSKTSLDGFILPDWINNDVWNDFLEVRKKLKAIPTLKAKQLLIKDLENFKAAGDDPSEVLNQSIKNSWKGLFALKKNGGSNNGKPQSDSKAWHQPIRYTRPEEL